jgi:hypothetical protein
MATRYWVGGAGSKSFQDTANWSATRGGAGGATAPTGTDEAFIESGTSDINSGLSNAAFTGQLTVSAGFSGTIGTSGGAGLIANLVQLRYSGSGRFAFFGSSGGNISFARIYDTRSSVRFVSGTVSALYVGIGCNVRSSNGVTLTLVQNGGGFIDIGTTGVGTYAGLGGSAVCVGSAATVSLYDGRFQLGGSAPITDSVSVFGSSTYSHKSAGAIEQIFVAPQATATSESAVFPFTITNSTRWIGSRFFDPSFVSITFTNPPIVEGGTF